VLVADRRDWDPASPGSFRKDIGFTDLSELARHVEIFKLCVVKDAGGMQDYHRRFCEDIGADAIVTYYHDQSVRPLNPWMFRYETIRTYHSVDATLEIEWPPQRKSAAVSGAISDAYPLRRAVALNRKTVRVDVINHPGYSNRGCVTPKYLNYLSQYRVHVATASRFGFALRKIIESVMMGTIPVTNLPAYDELPMIDGALVRISNNATLNEIQAAIEYADRAWNIEERANYAALARAFYDFRATGKALDAAIAAAAAARRVFA